MKLPKGRVKKKWKQGQAANEECKRTAWRSSNKIRKVKVPLEVKLARDMKHRKKYASNKRKFRSSWR